MTNPISSGSIYPSNYEDHENSWPEADNGDVNSLVLNRRIRDSILQVEKTLGEDPQGEEATVDARIATIEGKIPYITTITLGENVGDYKDICKVTTSSGSMIGRLVVAIDDILKSIEITKEFLFSNNSDDTAASWIELIPIDKKGVSSLENYDFAIDMNHNINECTFRIRIKSNLLSEPSVLANIYLEVYTRNAVITELNTDGTETSELYERYYWLSEETINFTLEKPSKDDDFLMLQMPHKTNLYMVWAVALGGGTATFNILSRSTPTASGIQIMTSNLTAKSSGVGYYPDFHKCIIDINKYLFLKPYAISGEVNQLMVKMICNRKFD